MIIKRIEEDADVAIIDYDKECGEQGQYEVYDNGDKRIPELIAKAEKEGKRVEHLLRGFNVKGKSGIKLGLEIVERELAPGKVMLFHWHNELYEITKVDKGYLGFIVNDKLDENLEEIMKVKHFIFGEGSVVVFEPGERHTIFNPGDRESSMTTIHSLQGRFPTVVYNFDAMPDDWHRRTIKSKF